MRINRRRVERSAVLVIALLFLAAGLFASGQGEATAKSMTLTWWTYPHITGMPGRAPSATDTQNEWHEFMAAEFQKKYPNVKIEVVLNPYTEGRDKLNVRILAGTPPEVNFDNASDGLKFSVQNLVEPIDAYLTEEDKEDIFPAILGMTGSGDKHYSWPIGAAVQALLVNRRIFNERGAVSLLPPSDDRTWTYDEFLKAAQAVTFDRDGDGKTDVYAVAVGFKDEPGDYHRYTWVAGTGARIFGGDGTQFTFNSPETVKGFQFLVDMERKYKIMVPGGLGMSQDEAQSLFWERKIAMVGAHPNVLLNLAKLLSSGAAKADDFDLYPVVYPHEPGKQGVVYANLIAMSVFKQPDAARVKMAMEFCRFISNNTKGWVEHSKRFPVRKSQGVFYANDPVMQGFAVTSRSGTGDYSNPYYNSLRSVLVPMTQAIMGVAKTPAQALKDVEPEAKAIIAKLLKK